MTRRTCLVASYHVPQGDRDSGSRREAQLIDLLLETGWTVHVLAVDGIGDRLGADRLESRGIAVHDARRTPIHRVLGEFRPDLAIVAFWPNAARLLPEIRAVSPGTRVIVDTVDLHFLRESRQAFTTPGPDGRIGLQAEDGAQFALELNSYASADGQLTVSQKEADLLADLLGARARAFAVPDYEDLAVSPVALAERRGIVCIGSFQHAPNREAVAYLCRDVLPHVDRHLLREHPVSIVGNELDEEVRALGRDAPEIHMVGWVPSVIPYLEQARVSVIPLLHGAGTKRKLVQALAVGTPSVSTSIGVEGLGLVDRETVLVADDPVAFAAAITTLLTDADLWRHLAEAGRAHVRQTNTRELAGEQLSAAIESVLSRPPSGLVPNRIPEAVGRGVGGGGSFGPPRRPAGLRTLGRGFAPVRRRLSRLRTAQSAPPTADAPAVLPALDADAPDRHEPAPREREPSVQTPTGPVRTDVRLIAFYLPQFHPIPENDAWWGEGFTEWRNVAQGRPQFAGHDQPRVPGDLGFYDLRLPETRAQQAQLARDHGVHGFCYYHYWFNGTQLLHRPFDEVLASGQPDFPFCLCWANDPWSRRWDGREDALLMPQTYSREDDLAHIRWLLPALADPRAIRVDGKPLFLVYRARSLPEPEVTADMWREEVQRAGLPGLHLVAVETAWDLGWDATERGFDAKVLFQPQFGWLMNGAAGARRTVTDKPQLQVYNYDAVRALVARLPAVSYRRYESVFPGWDNTPRVRDRAVVMRGATPEGYEDWLRAAVERAASQAGDDRLVFVNAWNEWAEGAYLEPDRRNAMAYLDATRRAMTADVCA